MGTGQMMLTVLAVFLLSTIILSMNRTYVDNTETIVRTKSNLVSISFATSQLQKAGRLAFDDFTKVANDTTVGPLVTDSSSFSAQLKWESGETGHGDTLFNDIDDYNGYLYTDSTQTGDKYNILTRVSYVSPSNPWGDTTAGKQWAKRVTVRVWPQVAGNLKPDTITLTQVFSYWRWR
ncbi:MAG: hypothetical protein ABSB78_09300 [Bacteroidota bacterium]